MVFVILLVFVILASAKDIGCEIVTRERNALVYIIPCCIQTEITPTTTKCRRQVTNLDVNPVKQAMKQTRSQQVSLKIRGTRSTTQCELHNVRTIHRLELPTQSMSLAEILK